MPTAAAGIDDGERQHRSGRLQAAPPVDLGVHLSGVGSTCTRAARVAVFHRLEEVTAMALIKRHETNAGGSAR